MLAFGTTGVLEAEWSLTTVVTNIVISIAHADALSMIIKFIKKDVDAIIIILTILVMMTLMMIVALEVANRRVVAAINNVCRVTGQTSGFPLIRSNMGEHGVWRGVSDLLLFTLTFYCVPLIWSNMGEHGVWGCF